MTDWTEVAIEIQCDSCGSKNVKRTNGIVLTSYPPLEPFACLNCGKRFYARTFNLGDKND